MDTWEQLLYPDHGEYSGLDQDDHPNYHTEDRKVAWHADPLRSGGDHLTNPTTHNHDGSAGMGESAARFRHGLASAKPSPTVANEVYLEEDTGDLYFASGSPLAWVKYSVIPIGSIVMFETACPDGWSRFQLMDGRIPKGAPTGAWTLFAIENDVNHTHVMADLVNHTHSIASKTFSTTSNGNHQHTIQLWGVIRWWGSIRELCLFDHPGDFNLKRYPTTPIQHLSLFTTPALLVMTQYLQLQPVIYRPIKNLYFARKLRRRK